MRIGHSSTNNYNNASKLRTKIRTMQSRSWIKFAKRAIAGVFVRRFLIWISVSSAEIYFWFLPIMYMIDYYWDRTSSLPVFRIEAVLKTKNSASLSATVWCAAISISNSGCQVLVQQRSWQHTSFLVWTLSVTCFIFRSFPLPLCISVFVIPHYMCMSPSVFLSSSLARPNLVRI